jgi:hypothetical protein
MPKHNSVVLRHGSTTPYWHYSAMRFSSILVVLSSGSGVPTKVSGQPRLVHCRPAGVLRWPFSAAVLIDVSILQLSAGKLYWP